MGLPKPDLVVFLQLRLAEAATRGEFGRERYENGKFQERALHCFHQLLADETLNWKVRGLLVSRPESGSKGPCCRAESPAGAWGASGVLCTAAPGSPRWRTAWELVPGGRVGESLPDGSSRTAVPCHLERATHESHLALPSVVFFKFI